MLQYSLFLVCTLTLMVNLSQTEDFGKDKLRRRKFPQCQACKIFTESFKRGMKRTEKGAFEGGDAAWEEERLGSYATSELRLVEVQEKLCVDVEEGRDQCYLMLEEYGDAVEEWWLNLQDEYPDLTKYFCMVKLPYCCPDLHYGTKCAPCPGYPNNICSNNGQCVGNGTRKGNGKCVCNRGYTGKNCESCGKKYYETQGDDQDNIVCLPCPPSCDGSCNKFGCEKCSGGWTMTKGGLCVDIDECSEHKPPCKSTQFCVNKEGSFSCQTCDLSCDGCTGRGPENCKSCTEGYKIVDGMCVQGMTYKDEPFIYITRVVIYFMIGTATCIVYRKNSLTAVLLGILFTAYMTPIEYMLNQINK